MTTLYNHSHLALIALALTIRTSFCMDPKGLEYLGAGRQPRISPAIRLISSSSQSSSSFAPEQTTAHSPAGIELPRILSEVHSLGLIPARDVRQALDSAEGKLLDEYSTVRTLVIYQDNPQLVFSVQETAQIFYLRNATMLVEILWIPYNAFKTLALAAQGKPNSKEVFAASLIRYIAEQRNQLAYRK
jgi:hypothetical protein